MIAKFQAINYAMGRATVISVCMHVSVRIITCNMSFSPMVLHVIPRLEWDCYMHLKVNLSDDDAGRAGKSKRHHRDIGNECSIPLWDQIRSNFRVSLAKTVALNSVNKISLVKSIKNKCFCHV